MLLCSLPLVFWNLYTLKKFLPEQVWDRAQEERQSVIHHRFGIFEMCARTRVPVMMSGNPDKMPSQVETK